VIARDLCLPYRAGRNGLGMRSWSWGSAQGRSTPSFHISGFQPSVRPGPKACHVIAWAGASTASAGPGKLTTKSSQAL
jgi:hypothetical protein